MTGPDADADSNSNADSEADTDRDVEYDRLVEHIRTQSKAAPGSDTERVTIRSLEAVNYDGLQELLSTIDEDETDADPAALAFYLSPTNAERILEDLEANDFDALEEKLGRPVHVESAMPEDAILYMDPEAVDLEADDERVIVDPEAIACATVGKAT